MQWTRTIRRSSSTSTRLHHQGTLQLAWRRSCAQIARPGWWWQRRSVVSREIHKELYRWKLRSRKHWHIRRSPFTSCHCLPSHPCQKSRRKTDREHCRNHLQPTKVPLPRKERGRDAKVPTRREGVRTSPRGLSAKPCRQHLERGYVGPLTSTEVAPRHLLEESVPVACTFVQNQGVKNHTACSTISDKQLRVFQFCRIQNLPFEAKAAPRTRDARSVNSTV